MSSIVHLPPPSRRRARGVLLALAVALLLAPVATAHFSRDHGSVTVHDTEDGSATGSVECGFFVRGRGMTEGEGTLVAVRSLGPAGIETVELGAWTGVADGEGTFSFEAGPFELPEADVDWFLFAKMGDHTTDSDTFAYAVCTDETEIPFFPGFTSLALGALGALGAIGYVLRRRS